MTRRRTTPNPRVPADEAATAEAVEADVTEADVVTAAASLAAAKGGRAAKVAARISAERANPVEEAVVEVPVDNPKGDEADT